MMLKCVLLDANVIIEAHEVGIWKKLIDKVEIVVSSIVAHKESLFYSELEGGIPEPINLKRLIQEGKIMELSATPEEMAGFLNNFDSVFVFGLHDGEVESLSLLKSGKIQDASFCSGDSTAIQALSMIGRSDAGISMERLLKQTGLQKNLKRQFREEFFKKQIAKGSENLITGQGLKR